LDPRAHDPAAFASLLNGDKPAWDRFVLRYAGFIAAAIRRVPGLDPGEVEDVAQDVFLRLCKDGMRLLRQYDPARAGLSTWLTIVARSAALDHLRRRRHATTPLEDAPESALSVAPVENERIKIPPDLLSARQALVVSMLYEREMEVTEIAALLGVDAQTVRSTHHKAMLKLRKHFGGETA